MNLNFLRILLSIFATYFLSSCVILNENVIPDDYTGPTAEIEDSFDYVDAGGIADFFYVVSVDGVAIENNLSATNSSSFGFLMVPAQKIRKVPVREINVEIAGTTHHALRVANLFEENLNVGGVVKFKPENDKKYFVRGVLKKKFSAVWIEESDSGDVVSKVIEIGNLTPDERNEFEDQFKQRKLAHKNRKELMARPRQDMNVLIAELDLHSKCQISGFGTDAKEPLAKGRHYYENKEYDLALACFVSSARDGNHEAASFIGTMYELGYGVEINLEKAMDWYKASGYMP